MTPSKVIRIHSEVYNKLLVFKHRLERKRRRAVIMSDVVKEALKHKKKED